LVPQTLNQRVQGSSPCAPTIDINGFGEVSVFNVRLIGSGEGEGTDFAVSLQGAKGRPRNRLAIFVAGSFVLQSRPAGLALSRDNPADKAAASPKSTFREQ
jgi:hypothetical protein